MKKKKGHPWQLLIVAGKYKFNSIESFWKSMVASKEETNDT